MTTPPDSPDAGASLFDPSLPFKGVVVCCTSIPPEQRSDIAAKTAELGGIHKYDLTPDVTHLVVGEYNTPKYRHVAKERPDIRPMAAGWIEAVRDLWVQDADIDFVSLEETWRLRTFETSGGDPNVAGKEGERGRLLCCLTGFDDVDQRQQIIDTIVANGGAYTGDMTRKVTHLIVHKPEGRKYAAAKSWEVLPVSIEWLQDSVRRGMILDEKLYDPILPKEERGKGAWTRTEVTRVSLGKRLREGAAAAQEDGKRKLRKTASMKLNSQRDNLWGDILGKPPSADPFPRPSDDPFSRPGDEPTQANTQASGRGGSAQTSGKSFDTQGSKLVSLGTSEDVSVFASCCFYVHGFPAKKAEVLMNTVAYMGGLVCNSLDEVASNSGAQLSHRFLIVPQNSRPDTHPSLPDDVQIITEFFIEKCMHKKQLFNPNEHVIGQPFPAFPIDGFERLAICTAGFTGVDLNQVDKAIRQLGARYEERFTSQSSVLVCTSLSSVRKQKLDLALAWRVPVVSADWLWSCISTGFKVPIKDFLFPELRQRLAPEQSEEHEQRQAKTKNTTTGQRKHAESARKPTVAGGIRDVDLSAFAHDEEDGNDIGAALRKDVSKEESDATTHFETAATHLSQVREPARLSAPLSEVSSNSRNRSSSPQKHAQPPRKPRSRVPSEIANSEATDEPDDLDNMMDVADENQNQIPPAQEDDAEAAGRRAEEKAAKRAAERLALSAKLTTLLDSTIGATAAASGDAADRREILGRAISNVSAASSGSVESSGVGAAATVSSNPNLLPKALSAAGSLAGAADGGGRGGGVGNGGRGAQSLSSPPPPPATQLEYEDAEAKRCKAELVRKMLGDSGGVGVGRRGPAEDQETLTLAGMGGYEVGRAGTGRGVGTRSTRRR
ncbi:S-M checkpoint control protein rad4 [Phialemonium atrogriseum]|uniref:S-M checkpoint control protein rad4 n=1 Tax=Phialemonium atrogriseum TaxID=1093897 RepID=A0AAJ0FIX1_9PEZI|nr:S-M checkpoint control protein rad4 [Phialemonium atrogriseum]KAK1763769.1 S-M checkpoint control protein rad4 [Phialemonium atrogriseum]